MTNRAAWLQAFHTGVSETQRQANIKAQAVDSTDTEPMDVKSINAPRSGSGKPRQGKTVTDKQAALILKLLNEKDTTNLKILHGQTIEPDKIDSMEIGRGSALIEKLFACPNRPSSVKITNQGSEKQRNYLASLMTQLNLSESDINGWGYKAIGDAITHLIQMTKAVKPQVTTTDDLTGMWTDGKRIIKAYLNREKTRVLAKELIEGSFEYLGMAQYHVKGMSKMTLDEAKQFGRDTGTCCQCGIELTDPESIAAGIGPICASKF